MLTLLVANPIARKSCYMKNGLSVCTKSRKNLLLCFDDPLHEARALHAHGLTQLRFLKKAIAAKRLRLVLRSQLHSPVSCSLLRNPRLPGIRMELLFARWTLHPLRIHAPSLRRGLDSSVRPIASSNALEGYWEQGRALFLLPVTDL